jgi:hypothetical protein
VEVYIARTYNRVVSPDINGCGYGNALQFLNLCTEGMNLTQCLFWVLTLTLFLETKAFQVATKDAGFKWKHTV